MVVAPTVAETLERALYRVGEPFRVALRSGRHEVLTDFGRARRRCQVLATIPACRLENLGDPQFRARHGVRFPCMSGAMANGIGSVEIVEAMARGGFLGVFGSAGLSLGAIEQALDRIEDGSSGPFPFGMNLIHSPGEPELESAVVDLYLRRRVRLVEASAFLNLTLPVVRYRVAGIMPRRLGQGDRAQSGHRQGVSRGSRLEVHGTAAPGHAARAGERGADHARASRAGARIPMADDVTAEADSGGHTDNQPAIVLLPTMIALLEQIQAKHAYKNPPRVGAAGGISTPWSAAAAFAMGAAYVVTGSVNQSCVEAGTSDAVRRMLAQAQQADIAMAPAADMFEMGVKVQVLKRGTLFAMCATKLYELYRAHESLDRLPEADRANLEKTIFRAPIAQIWQQTKAFFEQRDPSRIERAERDPKQKMALVFRWYLGMSSQWANQGDPARTVDYQIWCGPAMAAFNDWVRGTFLEQPENRRVATVALNILYGAAVLTRGRIASMQGLALPAGVPRLFPLEVDEIENRLMFS